jgi:hypothetical protein
MSWIYDQDGPDDDDDKMAALKRRADKWAKRYIHEIATLEGTLRVHFKIMNYHPGPAQYYAHVTMIAERHDYDLILRWSDELEQFVPHQDASIPNLSDGGFQIKEIVKEYMVNHPAITEYISSYNRASREFVFLQEKMTYLRRKLDWAELNSDSSKEACEIIHDLYAAYNQEGL